VKEAAQWIGVSDRTIYGYVKAGKLKASRIGSTIVVDARDIREYRRRAPGRLRTRIPPWHVPPEENLLYLTIMTVQLRPGQRKRLREKLLSIHALGKHLLPGTAARYIGYNRQCPDELQIVLVWRAAILPSEEERRAALIALRDDLAECVTWETAISQESQVIIHA
jgi:excisionase family DNA binding protein